MREALIRFTTVLLAVLTLACGEDKSNGTPTEPGTTNRPVAVVLGDSLTAGPGVASQNTYPSRLEVRARAAGLPHLVVNAGVSGDTTANGLARLDAALQPNTRVLVVALGANDGLLGRPLDSVRQNLREIITRARSRDIRVLLTGMIAPPNHGFDYAMRFADIYPELASEFNIPLMPFLLHNVLGRPDLNLPDGLHPNAAGHAVMADEMWPYLEPLLRATSSSTAP